ncbi:MAG TPA: ABA4-like family protein [Amycolatopsis sp.]|uniref:ABA4-like family protein n=1 Tax=Amycolatopsis sp. TaxID=37632 RepID=UPI002B4784D5|nr:ABA4-like family protein [Amycolatopsis sp.]HKS47950.1 ABA4-like family protein [Amycolatopsis sp.]
MTLFDSACYLAAPLWALMIFVPHWAWTRRIMSSPWVPLLPLAVYFAVALPHFGELWRVVSRPDLPALQAFLGQPYGATAIWAHLVAFDLFLGRWMYFEGRERGIGAPVVSPILLLTIFLSPIGLVAFLAVRSARSRRSSEPVGALRR